MFTSGSGWPTITQSNLAFIPSNTAKSLSDTWITGLHGSISLASSESDVSVGSLPLTDTWHADILSPAQFTALASYVPASLGKASMITSTALCWS